MTGEFAHVTAQDELVGKPQMLPGVFIPSAVALRLAKVFRNNRLRAAAKKPRNHAFQILDVFEPVQQYPGSGILINSTTILEAKRRVVYVDSRQRFQFKIKPVVEGSKHFWALQYFAAELQGELLGTRNKVKVVLKNGGKA